MPITAQQIEAAQAVQNAAAHDDAPQVRLIAGPGTGKSFAIEERVSSLLAQGVAPDAICVTSFTRASARDLRLRIHAHCARAQVDNGVDVPVTTLHALALRTLRRANLLGAYPSDPVVMADWELESVLDAEFGAAAGIGSVPRRREIRLHYEAFWSTGTWDPTNYFPPDPPITEAERQSFRAFHGPRTQCYSCVLPGEIVRNSVERIEAGTLNPVELLGIEHLVVDEFQDLNPMDLGFVDALAGQGATVFVCGDDDQSIYSFRFASPEGVNAFARDHPACAQHALSACFRCTPAVLSAAADLIGTFPNPDRVPKTLSSLYEASAPPVDGNIARWSFASGVAEARAIASSCRSLIDAGLDPGEILILLSSTPPLLPGLVEALDEMEVAYDSPRQETFAESKCGRSVLALLRVVCDSSDYVAHRLLLGMLRGVGVGTCHDIAEAVVTGNLNYRDLFYEPLPDDVFTARGERALGRVRAICSVLRDWDPGDTLSARGGEIERFLREAHTEEVAQEWTTAEATLPPGMSLEEARDYLWADRRDQQEAIMRSVLERCGDDGEGEEAPALVRIMTMHGAKGLSARVVFIPGLEEEILPGPRRRAYPGLILEAARLLYVSITRAKAACVLSLSRTRIDRGAFDTRTASRFTTHVGGAFQDRDVGLAADEVSSIMDEIANL